MVRLRSLNDEKSLVAPSAAPSAELFQQLHRALIRSEILLPEQ